MSSGLERRSAPRFPLILHVNYGGSGSARDCTENLSANGMFIRTDRMFAIGDRVPLIISFPTLLEPVTIEVEVMRCRKQEGPDSPAGVGVRIPADRSDDLKKLAKLADAASRAEGARVGGQRAHCRILVVDDNKMLLKMFADAFSNLMGQSQGVNVSIDLASNGKEALERLNGLPKIDLLITDLYMPEMNGIELIEKVRADGRLRDMPVIVVSHGNEADQRLITSMGAEFLRKPVDYFQIVRTVRSLMFLER